MIKQRFNITENDIDLAYETIKQIIDVKLKEYKVEFISSELAPNTYKGMVNYRKEFGQFLVYSGGDHGYLGQDYNIKFRALHDFMHYTLNLTFKFEDEKKLSDLTAQEFSDYAWDNLNKTAWECFVIREVLTAEIKGQIEYFEENKKYVDNQSQFVLNYITDRGRS